MKFAYMLIVNCAQVQICMEDLACNKSLKQQQNHLQLSQEKCNLIKNEILQPTPGTFQNYSQGEDSMYFYISSAWCGPGITETACPVCLNTSDGSMLQIPNAKHYLLLCSYSKIKFGTIFATLYSLSCRAAD